MTKNQFIRIALSVFFMLITFAGFAQQKRIRPDLETSELRPVNRHFAVVPKDGRKILRVDSLPDAGIVWIDGLNFSDGIIEFDVRGQDILQQSFVGIAFHGLNDSTYESVYFRPFNFLATDTARKKHAVQYMAVPKYEWSYLREKHPDQYEAGMPGSIDPNGWFHVKLVVKKKRIETFVGSNAKPVLIVNSLQAIQSGMVGFWVGNNSAGEFADLIIRK